MSSSDEYSLNWSNHTNHIKKAFGNLFSGSEFVDVTLSCEGKKITAHKMLLSACSVYFHDLFRDNACQHPIVIFKDVKYQNLVNILKFIYCGEASVATEDFDDFLKTAELLQISGLTDEDTRNSMTEKEKEVSDTTNVNVDDQTQVCEKETVVRKRKSEVDNVVDPLEKKAKVGEMNFDVVIKEEDIIHVDESSSYIKVPLEFEDNNKSTTVESLQFDDSQSSLDILDISSVNMVNAVHQIVAAANNALQENDDCEEVVSQTQQSFRRRGRPLQTQQSFRRRGRPLQIPRRGRRSYSFFKRKVLLLRLAYADCCPIKEECEMLTSWGLGYSVVEPKFILDWSTEEMEDYICTLYPKVPLKLVGFKVAKMDRQKKLLYINVENVKNLREAIGQSQIVIIPNQDLSVPVDANHVDMRTTDASATIRTKSDIKPVVYRGDYFDKEDL